MLHVLNRVRSRSRRPELLWLGGVVGALAGTILSLTSAPLPGSEPVTAEDVVDVGGLILMGAFGVALLRRRMAVGLGRALVAVTVLQGAGLLSSGVADALASQGRPGSPAQLLRLGGDLLYIPAVTLLVIAPLLLFPTGQLPSRRWRPVAGAAVVGVGLTVLSMALDPGPLDEDVPAWGDNPLGLGDLAGLLDVSSAVGLLLVVASVLGGLAAVAVRTARSRGPRRRQLLWFSLGVVVLIGGLVVDPGSSTTLGVVSALVVFGALLGTMAYSLLGRPGRAAARADA